MVAGLAKTIHEARPAPKAIRSRMPRTTTRTCNRLVSLIAATGDFVQPGSSCALADADAQMQTLAREVVWIDFVEVHVAGKHLSLDPVVVFLWLAYWGWVWGVVGLLLAYPMLAAVRVGLLHFEVTRGLGILLGDE